MRCFWGAVLKLFVLGLEAQADVLFFQRSMLSRLDQVKEAAVQRAPAGHWASSAASNDSSPVALFVPREDAQDVSELIHERSNQCNSTLLPELNSDVHLPTSCECFQTAE